MLQGYVATQVRRTSRNLLLTNIFLAIGILGLLTITFPYIMECLRGPFTITAEEIGNLSVKSDAPHRFFQLDLDQSKIDELHYRARGTKDNRNDYYYFYHLANDRILIIRTHSENVPERAIGSLSDFDADVQDKVLPGMQATLKGDMRPVMLDLSSYRLGLWIILGICIPLGALAGWNIKKATSRMGDPLKHPMAKQLATLGPPEEIAIAVDAEFNEGGTKVGKVLTTRSWLIRPTRYSTDLLYLGDIAWAYKHETVHKSHGVTTGRTYSTVIYDIRGKRWNFPLSQPQVETLLAELKNRVPWALIGFNADLQKAWQKSRAEVLASIEERKREITSAAQSAPTEPEPAQEIDEKIDGELRPVQGESPSNNDGKIDP